MPTLELDFEVWCSCGEGLCNQTDTRGRQKRVGITISPCEKCLSREYDKGFKDGADSKKEEE